MPDSSASPRLSTLIVLSALAILPLNVVLPSLPQMAADFGVHYGLIGFSLAAYAIVSASLQLVLGPLSDRFGRRPVILGAIGIFIAATIGCAVAQDIWIFLACRMTQAVIAPTYGVSLAAVRDTTSREQAASKFGYIAMAWAIAPMLGPTVGGIIDQLFGWRATFYALALLGCAVLALCWVDLFETNRSRSQTMLAQYKSYPALLGSRRFIAYCLCMAFSVGTFYVFLAGAPIAASAFNLSPVVLGLYMGSITGGFMLAVFWPDGWRANFRRPNC